MVLGDELYFELDKLARINIKDYCVQQGITTQDFRLQKKAELMKVLKGAEV
jgi:hypothetical protein